MTSLCTKCEERFQKTNEDASKTLQDTVKDCHDDCLQWLVNHGADVNTRNARGETPLHQVTQKGNYNCVKLLIKAGADVNEKTKYAIWSFVIGSQDAHYDLLHGIETDVNTVSYDGDTALIYAAIYASIECVNLLLESGANVNDESYNGNTALMAAAIRGIIECVKALVRAGADGKNPALLLAAKNCHLKCVGFLVKSGADVNVTDREGSTPLMIASKKGNTVLINFLIAEGADVNVTNDGGQSVLSLAAKYGQNKSIKLLLQAGADVNRVIPKCGPTVAIVASRCSAQSLWSLIRAGADVNVLTPSGETLLIVAAEYNEQYGCECIKLLLNIGAKINQVDWQGDNALQSHIWYCTWEKRIPKVDTNICMLLFAAGESPDGSTTLPDCLSFDSLRLCLKHLCREAIRNRLRLVDRENQSLFHLVPKLGLPSLLTDYLLYDVSLDIDINDGDTDDID